MFSEFYKQEASAMNRCLAIVFVGKSKDDCASEVDHNLAVVDAICCFGQYVKFYVELTDSSSSSLASNTADGPGVKIDVKVLL